MLDWYPCDGLGFPFDDVYFRALDVAAPLALVYRWLCQLRAGYFPPRRARREFDHLQAGQRFASAFRIVAFEAGRHVTVALRRRALERTLGDVAATFRLKPDYAGTRLILKELVRYPGGLFGFPGRLLRPSLDLIALRTQLRLVARRAERDYLVFSDA